MNTALGIAGLAIVLLAAYKLGQQRGFGEGYGTAIRGVAQMLQGEETNDFIETQRENSPWQ